MITVEIVLIPFVSGLSFHLGVAPLYAFSVRS